MLTSMLFPLFLHFFQPGRLSKGFPVVPKYTLARPDRPKAMPPAHCLSSFWNAESLKMGYPKKVHKVYAEKFGCCLPSNLGVPWGTLSLDKPKLSQVDIPNGGISWVVFFHLHSSMACVKPSRRAELTFRVDKT